MTLKIATNGANERIITPLRTFINGSRVRLSKGFTFINGEKVKLWGNTRTEFFSMPYALGFGTKNMYIDSNNLYVWGSQVMIGGTTRFLYSNCVVYYTITNPTNATEDGYSQWGGYPVFSPDESDENAYIYYMTKDATMNKVKIEKGVGASVVSTYSVPNYHRPVTYSVMWCVPLSTSNNLWMGMTVINNVRTYSLWVNGTSIGTVSGNAYGTPSYDNGDFVITHNGVFLFLCNESGSSRITNNTYITTKIVDGDYVFVAGKKATTEYIGDLSTTYAKIAKYDTTNNSTVWEVVFSDDRILKVVGEGNNKYFVIDEPTDYNSSDQNVYLRIYDKSNGTELETLTINYEATGGQRIIGWDTFPTKAKNGILSIQYPESDKLYVLKVFTD